MKHTRDGARTSNGLMSLAEIKKGQAFAARNLAQRALAAAAMAARPAALMRRCFGALAVPAAFAFAQRILRAFARALISLRRCAADNLRLPGAGATDSPSPSWVSLPMMDVNWDCNESIFSLITITRCSSATEYSESCFISHKPALVLWRSQHVSRQLHSLYQSMKKLFLSICRAYSGLST